jgi:hypothetical protein
MLGKFLELSVLAADTGASWQQFRQMGFADAAAGDVFAHAYGVVACADIAIGLHAQQDEPLCISFVKPDVAALHRALQASQQRIEFARLGSDSFNLLALREPGGLLLKVLEARTFSPPLEPPTETALGRCLGFSLPCRDFAAAEQFWSGLGMPGCARTEPWEQWQVDLLPIRYHLRRLLPEPLLLFDRSARLTDDETRALGLVAARLAPTLDSDAIQLFHIRDEFAALVLINQNQS